MTEPLDLKLMSANRSTASDSISFSKCFTEISVTIYSTTLFQIVVRQYLLRNYMVTRGRLSGSYLSAFEFNTVVKSKKNNGLVYFSVSLRLFGLLWLHSKCFSI